MLEPAHIPDLSRVSPPRLRHPCQASEERRLADTYTSKHIHIYFEVFHSSCTYAAVHKIVLHENSLVPLLRPRPWLTVPPRILSSLLLWTLSILCIISILFILSIYLFYAFYIHMIYICPATGRHTLEKRLKSKLVFFFFRFGHRPRALETMMWC